MHVHKRIGLTGMFWALVTVASVPASVFTITGFLGGTWWVFDLTAHFRVQYAVILLFSAGLVALRRRPILAMALAVLALVNIAVIAPRLPRKAIPTRANPTLRAMLINVHTDNTRYDLVQRFVADRKPDILVLEEVDSNWIKQMAPLETEYSHRIVEPRDDNFGIALFSRFPFKEGRVIPFGDEEIPSILATIQFDQRELTILATHPLPPGSRHNSQTRNAQLAAIPAWIPVQRGERLLLGDLNITPWSYCFGKLIAETGLKDSSAGRGIHATWPTHLLPMRIPIDHCLMSAGLKVVAKEVGPYVGSDHFPLFVEFGFVRRAGN